MMLSREQYCLVARLIQTTNLSLRAIAKTAECSHVSVKNLKEKLIEKSLTWQQLEAMGETLLVSTLHPNWPYRSIKKTEIPKEEIVEYASQPKQTYRNAYYDIYVPRCPIGTAYKITRFYEIMREYRKTTQLSMRMAYNAGEIVYVDYAGTAIPYTPEGSDQKIKASAFVGTLAASSALFICATPGQTTKDWIDGHTAMFEFFGGVTKVVIPDNPKSLVTSSNPQKVLNKNYEAFAAHYRTTILPARVKKPKDKGSVENSVGFCTNRIIARALKMEFKSIDEINAFLLRECQKLNNEKFQKLNISRSIRFKNIDQPALMPLPKEPYEFIEHIFSMKVPADYCLLILEHYYSVSYEHAHKPVTVLVKANKVEVFCKGRRIARHKRSNAVGELTRNFEHMPPNHQFFEDKDIEYYWQWAEPFGEATKKIIAIQFDGNYKKSRLANERCRKIINTAKSSNLSHEAFEKACKFALEYGYTSPTALNDLVITKGYEVTLRASSVPESVLYSGKHLRGSDYFNSQD